MPDMTMCVSQDCVKRNTCYRQTANYDMFQSYTDFFVYETEECSYYIEDTRVSGE